MKQQLFNVVDWKVLMTKPLSDDLDQYELKVINFYQQMDWPGNHKEDITIASTISI